MKRVHFISVLRYSIGMSKPTQSMQALGELSELADLNKKACKPAGRPKAADLEARQQNLVMTAAHLFLDHGYGNVSLEMIAREAHVAVRTIYTKFGGKAGLLKAAIDANRERFYSTYNLETDARAMRESLGEFARHFFDMVTGPHAVRMKRMVLAESTRDPELTQTFLASGPLQTRAMLERFFKRPDIRAQMFDDVPLELLPEFFLTCVVGDQYTHLLDTDPGAIDAVRAGLPARLGLFFRAVLRA